MTPSAPADFPSLEQAARWYACLRDESATEDDRAQWRDWLAQRPEHRSAWQYVEAVGRRFEPLQGGDPDAAAAGLRAARRRLPRRAVLGVAAAAAGVGLAGAWRTTPLPEAWAAWTADHRTGVGEIRRIVLSDGTQVWLNTASALDVDYGRSLRRLRLAAGEILVQTAHDAGRDFVVETGQGSLRALGTRFSVRSDPAGTRVAVYEGAVEIRTAAGGQARVVAAGSQAGFTADGISAPGPADPARESWAQGLILANNVTLAELAGELSRYRRGHLGVADEVAGLRVIGAYPARDPDRALAILQEALPVRVHRTLPWWVTIQAK